MIKTEEGAGMVDQLKRDLLDRFLPHLSGVES
jgi:hypothetical protein